MDKEYLSVKEYAKIKGVSTQYVYRLLQTKLQTFVVVVDGRKYLKSEVLRSDEIEVANQETNQETKFATKVANQVENSKRDDKASSSSISEDKERIKKNEEVIESLRAQLIEKDNQLKEKDEYLREKDSQIKEQTEQIINLSNKITELFENNQKLQLNYQLLLSNNTDIKYEDVNEEDEEQSTQAQDVSIDEPIEEIPKKNKRSWFKWFFSK